MQPFFAPMPPSSVTTIAPSAMRKKIARRQFRRFVFSSLRRSGSCGISIWGAGTGAGMSYA